MGEDSPRRPRALDDRSIVYFIGVKHSILLRGKYTIRRTHYCEECVSRHTRRLYMRKTFYPKGRRKHAYSVQRFVPIGWLCLMCGHAEVTEKPLRAEGE